MFRTRSHLRIFRTILRHTNIASRCPTAYYKVQVRDTCPPKPPPPPPKPKDDSGFWGAMTVAFIAAGFAFIAKQNPEIRDWLSIYAPWFDDIIAVLFEENMTYAEFGQKCVRDAKQFFTGSVKDDKPKPCSLDAADKPKISHPEAAKKNTDESIDPDNPPPCEEPPEIVVTKTACEIVERLKESGNDVLSNYYTADRACSLYNQIVADTMANFSFPTLKELHGHMAERINLVKTSIKNADAATSDIEELSRYIECGAKGTKEDIENAKTLIKDYQQQIKASKIQWEWENDKSIVLDSQWQKVEYLIDKYSDENETMFSELKYDENKLALNGDMDLLLYHTYRYSNLLKSELKDVAFGMTDRVNRAFETLPQGDKEKKNREYMVQNALKQKRAELDKEFRKRYDDQRAANDKLLKESLKLQLEHHKALEEDRLLEVEREATVKLNKLVSEKVAFEKMLFAQQLKEMATKLKLVEEKLNARLKAESETRRSQELWAAGACLLAATHCGESLVSVDIELDAIEKASGDGDKLVRTVLKAIPPSIREKGLVPESVLRAKYHEMEKTALKVALVEQDGGPLPVYFLSWLMSMLLFMKVSGIPQEEVDNPPKEPYDHLDTYDLLQRARFWLERGNLSAAVRYVSALKGASLAAMLSWRDSAHAHLETRQAAEAILAHAAALAMQYICLYSLKIMRLDAHKPEDPSGASEQVHTDCHRGAVVRPQHRPSQGSWPSDDRTVLQGLSKSYFDRAVDHANPLVVRAALYSPIRAHKVCFRRPRSVLEDPDDTITIASQARCGEVVVGAQASVVESDVTTDSSKIEKKMLMIILILVVCGLWMWLRRSGNKNEPPTIPGGLPLIGHAHMIIGDSVKLWKSVKELSYESLRLGGVLSASIGPRKIYILTDPEDYLTIANTCLQKDGFYEFAKPWLGEGLVTGNLSIWKVHRKLLNPAFSSLVLDGFMEVFNIQSRRLVQDLEAEVGKGPFDHWVYTRHNALETICLTALGVDFSDKSVLNSEYVHATEQIFNVFVDRFQKFWLHNHFIYSWSGLRRKQDECLKILHNMSYTVLKQRKADYLNNRNSPKVHDKALGPKFKPFMDLLLELAIEKGAFNDQEIREHVDTMIVGGHDTSASVLMYSMLLVGSYPHVQQKIFEELQDVFGGDDRDVTKHDLSQLVYLEAVLKESMRIYPIVPVTARYLDRDIKLRNYTLSKGRTCFMFIYGVHRHPMWGPDAEEFKPERWLDPATLPECPTAFAGFSMGRRICIGKSYAYMSMKITLAHVFRNYKVKGDHTQLETKIDVMLKPHSGYYITIEKRNKEENLKD